MHIKRNQQARLCGIYIMCVCDWRCRCWCVFFLCSSCFTRGAYSHICDRINAIFRIYTQTIGWIFVARILYFLFANSCFVHSHVSAWWCLDFQCCVFFRKSFFKWFDLIWCFLRVHLLGQILLRSIDFRRFQLTHIFFFLQAKNIPIIIVHLRNCFRCTSIYLLKS